MCTTVLAIIMPSRITNKCVIVLVPRRLYKQMSLTLIPYRHQRKLSDEKPMVSLQSAVLLKDGLLLRYGPVKQIQNLS